MLEIRPIAPILRPFSALDDGGLGGAVAVIGTILSCGDTDNRGISAPCTLLLGRPSRIPRYLRLGYLLGVFLVLVVIAEKTAMIREESTKMRLLIVGAGGVGSAAVGIAARRDFLERCVVADYAPARAE